MRVGLLALAALVAWTPAARAQTVIEREGVYPRRANQARCAAARFST